MCKSLINKYTIKETQYASYPNVSFWDNDAFSLERWHNFLKKSFNKSNSSQGISLYIHLPFCENKCEICNNYMQVTANHEVELPYIKAVLKEWHMYTQLLDDKPVINELHLGGGTPTFFSPKNLQSLVSGLLSVSKLSEDYVFSFEGHPKYTSSIHLQALYDLGFRRVSFGVQDYNTKIQNAINRVQSFENVEDVTKLAREIGYTSVGHDIVFGLPFQTTNDIVNTIEKTKALLPDRIAFYSYAHNPDKDNEEEVAFTKNDLPTQMARQKQYRLGKSLLKDAGYFEIGMDYFALESDALYRAMKNDELHRNFLGYTASKTQVMLGLGVSSISDIWYGFSQNVKSIEAYYRLLATNKLPISKGHILTDDDFVIRQHILNLMSHFRTSWVTETEQFSELPDVIINLKAFEEEGLITFKRRGLTVTEKGKPFIRNICMAFDLRMKQQQTEVESILKTS